jgi:hypothetical protein
METFEQNPAVLPGEVAEQLRACRDVGAIDAVLDSFGYPPGLKERNELLMSHMGVLSVFVACDEDIESNIQLQYDMTKEVFVDGDWKYMNGRN